MTAPCPLDVQMPLPLRHRGFELALRRESQEGPFSFRVSHFGFDLHTSRPGFGTATAAERAARQFVDDALGAFGHAAQTLAA
jgi:hypothetical protein